MRLWRGIHRTELFDPGECRALLALADELLGWREAMVSVGGTSQVRLRARRARQLSVAGERADPEVRERLSPFLARVEERVRELDGRFFHSGLQGIRDAQLVDYERGGFYRWHRDARDASYRKLTALCYLTDRDSHELRGGETSFAPPALVPLLLRTCLRDASGHGLRFLPTVQRPRQGRAIVFDARIPHRAHRVRRGRKVALNVWFV